jgi:hypothetical protein
MRIVVPTGGLLGVMFSTGNSVYQEGVAKSSLYLEGQTHRTYVDGYTQSFPNNRGFINRYVHMNQVCSACGGCPAGQYRKSVSIHTPCFSHCACEMQSFTPYTQRYDTY